jgi:hypothetical protein
VYAHDHGRSSLVLLVPCQRFTQLYVEQRSTPRHAPRCCLQGEDDGSSILGVPAYLDSREGEKPLGVYAVYDERHALQYVGYSRNMVLAIKVGRRELTGASRKALPGRLAVSMQRVAGSAGRGAAHAARPRHTMSVVLRDGSRHFQ